MRWQWLVVVGAVMALAVAGCAGEEPESGEIGGASPAGAGPRPAPEEPEEQQQGSEEQQGSESEPVPELKEVPGEVPEVTFVKHFYDAYWYAVRTGDTERYQELVHPECEMCHANIRWVADAYGEGGAIEGDTGELLEEPHLRDDAEQASVIVVYQEPKQTVLDADGEVANELPPCAHITETLTLYDEGEGEWLIGDMHHSLECDD